MSRATRWTYLERKRIAAGHTKQSLAAAVGVGTPHIHRIERGIRGVSPELYRRLADALNVDIEELISSAPEPPPQSSTRMSIAS